MMAKLIKKRDSFIRKIGKNYFISSMLTSTFNSRNEVISEIK